MRGIHTALAKAKLATRDLEPHIGIAFCSTLKEAEALRQTYQGSFKTISFPVKFLYVMKRIAEDDPFEPFVAIPLKGCESFPPEHKLVVK